MHYTKSTIASFIHQAGILVHNSKNVDDIRNAVVQYGYDERRLTRGERVFEKLREISFRQEKAKTVKAEKYRLKLNLQKVIHKNYMKYLKIARIAFSDDLKARNVLLLEGARERTFKEWYFQVSVFCSIMLKNDDRYLQKMAVYGIDRIQIETLNKNLVELNKLRNECIKSSGELKKLTAEKRVLVIEMQDYVSDFIKIARIALENSPKVLKNLGLSVKN